MSKYKSHRPEERWESNKNLNGGLPAPKPPRKRPSNRPRKKNQPADAFTSDANFLPSDIYYPPSEAYHLHSEAVGPAEGVSPSDTTGQIQQQDSSIIQQNLQVHRVELPTKQLQATRPAKRLNAMTSDAASAALRRAIQSSPARWVGTQDSPIEVDDEMGSTRRLLFPSPRKDGSPKVLGEVETNVVQIATDFRSPKEQSVNVLNKENCPPALSTAEDDAEFLALFEDEMARPTTPVQTAPLTNPFKTPTRPTPNHRPITRSVSKSIRSARSAKSPGELPMLGQRTQSRTPGSIALRRSPRFQDAGFESPFTATINQIMSEANNEMSPSRHCNMDLDFANLPDLPIMDGTMQNAVQADLNFNLEDFFSTDVPMPSSPPRFHLYEDPAAMVNVDWSEFDRFDENLLNAGMGQTSEEVEIKEEPTDETQGFSEEHTETTTEQQQVKEKQTEEPNEEDEVDMVGVGQK